MQPAHEVSLRS